MARQDADREGQHAHQFKTPVHFVIIGKGSADQEKLLPCTDKEELEPCITSMISEMPASHRQVATAQTNQPVAVVLQGKKPDLSTVTMTYDPDISPCNSSKRSMNSIGHRPSPHCSCTIDTCISHHERSLETYPNDLFHQRRRMFRRQLQDMT